MFPIDEYLPEIERTLREKRRLVLTAAPGAGKTARVPAAAVRVFGGQVILLEPRRVAAKMAAAHLAKLDNSELGGKFGFQVRGESLISCATQLVAMPPGLLVRRLLEDAALEGVSAVIFDEFHERGSDSDTAFALIGDLARQLRPELGIVVMSATIDAAKLSRVLDNAPILEIPGRTFPVECRWTEEPVPPREAPEWCARQIKRLLQENSAGDLLVFLPGVGEIKSTAALLNDLDAGKFAVLPLYGALDLKEQSRVIAPDKQGRCKIILSTNVAESSITIDGVTRVIDSGLEKVMRYAPGTGLPVLESAKISLASAVQRSGRAGRTAPGIAWRMWTKLEEAARPEYTPAEILTGDLAKTVLAAAYWGTPLFELPWFELPPEAAVKSGETVLRDLGAMDEKNQLTALGKKLSLMPLHPKLGAMLCQAVNLGNLDLAILVAAILGEPECRRSFHSADVREIVNQIRRHPAAYPRIAEVCRQLRGLFARRDFPNRESDVSECGNVIALAFPERVARRRNGQNGVYKLAGPGSAEMDLEDDLIREEFIAVAELDKGRGVNGRIRLAAPLAEAEINDLFGNRITVAERVFFNPAKERLLAVRERRFMELVLSSGNIAVPPALAAEYVLNEAEARGIALPPADNKAAVRLTERVKFAGRSQNGTYPDWESPDGRKTLFKILSERMENLKSLADLDRQPWNDLLRDILGWNLLQQLKKDCPDSFTAPSGREFKIDYSSGVPTLAIRIQELYGVDEQPKSGKQCLKLELLSPAGRPVQVTCDLPGFWRGSWQIVRKEMRSRYPKHDWPEKPWEGGRRH